MPDAGRVVTGSAGGLRLEAPGAGTRPLSDKVKQALFSMIEAEREDVWERPMLDLFAGSGAAGIEALSRGAPGGGAGGEGRPCRGGHPTQPRAHRPRRQMRRVVRRDVLAFLSDPAPGPAPFGCVVLDPPYAQSPTCSPRWSIWAQRMPIGSTPRPSSWPSTSGRTRRRERFGRLVRARERRFGETALSVYRRGPEPRRGRP